MHLVSLNVDPLKSRGAVTYLWPLFNAHVNHYQINSWKRKPLSPYNV